MGAKLKYEIRWFPHKFEHILSSHFQDIAAVGVKSLFEIIICNIRDETSFTISFDDCFY